MGAAASGTSGCTSHWSGLFPVDPTCQIGARVPDSCASALEGAAERRSSHCGRCEDVQVDVRLTAGACGDRGAVPGAEAAGGQVKAAVVGATPAGADKT